MPALRNPTHEKFAQYVAKGGTSTLAAYEAAGYKPSAPNASRLRKNPLVVARIAELVELGAQAAIATIGFAAIDLFRRLEQDIQDAKKAGKHEAAMKGRIAMIEAFGYTKDSPTLTHEAILGKSVSTGEAKTGAPGDDLGAPQEAPANRFAHMLAELKKPLPARN